MPHPKPQTPSALDCATGGLASTCAGSPTSHSATGRQATARGAPPADESEITASMCPPAMHENAAPPDQLQDPTRGSEQAAARASASTLWRRGLGALAASQAAAARAGGCAFSASALAWSTSASGVTGRLHRRLQWDCPPTECIPGGRSAARASFAASAAGPSSQPTACASRRCLEQDAHSLPPAMLQWNQARVLPALNLCQF
eukprot:350572-Chlamydomonas_euryale.AAC.10